MTEQLQKGQEVLLTAADVCRKTGLRLSQLDYMVRDQRIKCQNYGKGVARSFSPAVVDEILAILERRGVLNRIPKADANPGDSTDAH